MSRTAAGPVEADSKDPADHPVGPGVASRPDPFDVAAGRTEQEVVESIGLPAISDAALDHLAAAVADEQRRRALETGDLDALVELGFDQGFTSNGVAREPWLLDRMIIVPGSKVERSKLSHDCRFAKIGDSWSWDSPEREAHVIRNQQGAKTIMQTVTLVPAREGLGIDIIGQQMRTGAHRVREVHSYEFKAGELVLVSARAIGDSASH